MKTTLKIFLAVVVILLAYLLAWPVAVDPKSWDAPPAPAMTGVFAVNGRLADFQALELDGLTGPEAVISNQQGDIYATTHEGWIIRWINGAGRPQRWVDVGGRPLGIAFDQAQNLWVANAYIGLQKIDPSGAVTTEATAAEEVPIRYADDLVVTPDGKVYFSDASSKFSAAASGSTLAASLLDIMEHGLYGRIIEFDPQTGATRVVMHDLSFANGVTAAPDGEFLLVAETGGYRIWKHWLAGDKAGQSEVLIDNLPGFPDNVHVGQNGRYWVGLTSPRSTILDDLADQPRKRKIIQRLPAFMRPNVVPYGHVLAINAAGQVLVSLQDPQGAYPATTGALETEEYLYVSSLTAPILARFDKAALGL